ncbi:MAG: hypothetical protein ACKOEK_04750 [Actinomycetota bacterium]
MSRLRWKRVLCGLIVLGVVPVVGAPSADAVRPSIRPMADVGQVEFEVALDIAGVAQRAVSLGALNCSDGSSTYADPTAMLAGLYGDPRLRASLTLSCNPSLSIDSGVQQVRGTFTVPAKGIGDGVITANCSARAGITITAAVSVGLGIPGLISMNVSSAGSPLPIGCDFVGESASTSTKITGTIQGYSSVVGMCSSACVALSMTADATVTSATGVLDGQSGSGTYTYSDAFEVPQMAAIADRLASMRNSPRTRDERVSCPEGATSCAEYSTSPCPNGEDSCATTTVVGPTFVCPTGAVCTTSPPTTVVVQRLSVGRPPAVMKLDLRNVTPRATVVRPMPAGPGKTAVLSSGSTLAVAARPGTQCSILFVGKKRLLRKAESSASGTVTLTYSRAQLVALMKQVGVAKKGSTNPTVALTATCAGSPATTMRLELAS